MKIWPEDVDVFKTFVGKTLDAITFAEYSLYLDFQDKFMVSIFSGFKYCLGKIVEEGKFPIRQTHLVSSIGSKIVKVELVNNKDLSLWFQDGAKLEIDCSRIGYECYSIKFADREFYVSG